MNFIKDINKTIKNNEEDALALAAVEEASEIESMLPEKRFSLDSYFVIQGTINDEELSESEQLNEFFGSSQKKKEREARARAVARGKSSRGNANKESSVKGGKDNSGLLAQINKEFGVAKLVNGKLPKIPAGMSRPDYEIWVSLLLSQMETKKPTDLGAKMGPEKGDVIRKNGQVWLVTNPNTKKDGRSFATVKNRAGDVVDIDWAKLPKPKDFEGKSVYDL